MTQIQPELQMMFDAVDIDRSGRISAVELQKVLTSRGDRVTLEACYLLIRLFDEGMSSIDIYGFARLFVLFVSWTEVFKKFDVDKSGFIDKKELMVALRQLYPTYPFSQTIVDMLTRKFGDPFKQGLTDDQFLFVCAYVEKSPPTTNLH